MESHPFIHASETMSMQHRYGICLEFFIQVLQSFFLLVRSGFFLRFYPQIEPVIKSDLVLTSRLRHGLKT